jgi:hypothetical protein
MDMLHNAGIFAKLTLVMDLLPLGVAVLFVVRPTEHNLALMRPFSLAGLFAALSGGAVGFLNVLRSIGATQEFTHAAYSRMAIGASEALVPTFVGFACLSAAWLLVAVGMSRRHAEV